MISAVMIYIEFQKSWSGSAARTDRMFVFCVYVTAESWLITPRQRQCGQALSLYMMWQTFGIVIARHCLLRRTRGFVFFCDSSVSGRRSAVTRFCCSISPTPALIRPNREPSDWPGFRRFALRWDVSPIWRGFSRSSAMGIWFYGAEGGADGRADFDFCSEFFVGWSSAISNRWMSDRMDRRSVVITWLIAVSDPSSGCLLGANNFTFF